MADASECIRGRLDFHPCDAPRGMTFYKLDDITAEQKLKLKQYKLKVIRENQTYLNKHPEIRVIVRYLLKAILKARPKIRLTQFLAEYLMMNWEELKEHIDKATVSQTPSFHTSRKGSLLSSPCESAEGFETNSERESNASVYKKRFSRRSSDFAAEVVNEIMSRVDTSIETNSDQSSDQSSRNREHSSILTMDIASFIDF